MDLIARAVRGEQLRIEWHGKSKDGSLRWHEVFVKRVTIGGQDRILALARDITGRKAGRGGAARERGAVPRDVQRVDRRPRAVECRTARSSTPIPRCGGCTATATASLPRLPTRHCGTGPLLSRRVPAIAVAAGESLHSEVTERRKDGSPLELEVHGIPMQYQGKPPRADDRSRHHREEALRGGAGAAARIAVSAREARRARFAAGRRRRTSSTIRCRSSWRARCCSRSRAIRPRRPRR